MTSQQENEPKLKIYKKGAAAEEESGQPPKMVWTEIGYPEEAITAELKAKLQKYLYVPTSEDLARYVEAGGKVYPPEEQKDPCGDPAKYVFIARYTAGDWSVEIPMPGVSNYRQFLKTLPEEASDRLVAVKAEEEGFLVIIPQDPAVLKQIAGAEEICWDWQNFSPHLHRFGNPIKSTWSQKDFFTVMDMSSLPFLVYSCTPLLIQRTVGGITKEFESIAYHFQDETILEFTGTPAAGFIALSPAPSLPAGKT